MSVFKLHTPLEEQLFKYIKFLLQVIGILASFQNATNNLSSELNKMVYENMAQLNTREMQMEINSVLKSEFGWEINQAGPVEINDKKEIIQ
jgi:hypothetical protein